MTRTLSTTIKENNYQDLKKLIDPRQISKFFNQVVEKDLEKKKKELISAYQTSATYSIEFIVLTITSV